MSVATLGLGAAVALGPSADAAVSPAVAKHKHGCDTGADDFDGNGGTDLAIGYPHSGTVRVEMKTKRGVREVVLHHPHGVHKFGRSVSDVDLSRHTDGSQPCADLVVGAVGRVFIYRWRAATKRFARLNEITAGSLVPHGPKVKGFGAALATQIEPGKRPTARKPVLYVSAPFGHPRTATCTP